MSVTSTPRYGRRNRGLQCSHQIAAGLSKFAVSTERHISPRCLHIPLFFFSFCTRRVRSSAGFKRAT